VRNFWSYISNGNFSVGCTGQTVYLYDKHNNEIAKFKDIIYAYMPGISPDGKILVVKSTDGRLAVYSLENLSLIKKFRFSKVDGCQDDGFCFSPDSKFFINIERQGDSLHSAISFYDTSDFSLVKQICFDDKMMLDHIEFDKITNTYYVLGFVRNSKGILSNGFVAELKNYEIKNMILFSEDEYDFYHSYKNLELMGFTEKAYEWSYLDCELNRLKSLDKTLAEIYAQYNK